MWKLFRRRTILKKMARLSRTLIRNMSWRRERREILGVKVGLNEKENVEEKKY